MKGAILKVTLGFNAISKYVQYYGELQGFTCTLGTYWELLQ